MGCNMQMMKNNNKSFYGHFSFENMLVYDYDDTHRSIISNGSNFQVLRFTVSTIRNPKILYIYIYILVKIINTQTRKFIEQSKQNFKNKNCVKYLKIWKILK